MKIAVVGTGYVGLVTGACLAEADNAVVCIDKDEDKILRLRAGQVPFYEPGLDDVVRREVDRGTLGFAADLAEGVDQAEVIFLAIGTPCGEDGRASLGDLLECARHLAKIVAGNPLIVIKSTVPVGTCERVRAIFESTARRDGERIDVASNPEFLAEGRAVQDFRQPERIVLGCDTDRAASLLTRLYRPFDGGGNRLLTMDVRSAEFAKYACNAMLAARVSLVNELSGIAGELDADMMKVCQVMGSDPRIGPKYLQPGAGYGGSCLPKDLRALISMAEDADEPAHLLRSIETVNRRQGQLLFGAIRDVFRGDLRGRCVAIWGLAFKPGTDDVRAAPSVALIRALLAAGARVQAYDPVAGTAVRRLVPDTALTIAGSAESACRNADALAVMTEWEEFRDPDFAQVAMHLAAGVVFDARNLYRRDRVARHGLQLYRLGQRRSERPERIRDGRHWHNACYGNNADRRMPLPT